MKKINYILFILVSLFIFGYKVNALSIAGDGEWHTVSYTTLRDEHGVRGNVTSCNAMSSNIEVKLNNDGTTTCQVRSKTKTDSDVNAQFSVGWVYSGHTGSSTVDTKVTKLSSSSTSSGSNSSSSNTNGEDYFKICDASTNPQLVASFKLIGIFVNIVKIIVPIILIIMGSLDMSKAVIDKNNDAIQKALIVFLKRAIAAVLVFLAPNIILGLFHMIDGMDNFDSAYSTCVDCILGSSSCPNVSFIQGS